jgi:cytochrome oxidase Cu insertion factor (SCO1/SenC/PrrC family)
MKQKWLIGVILILAWAMSACGSPATSTASTAVPAAKAPQPGDVAPDFTLPDSKGNQIHLTEELKSNRVVVLVFYQGAT